MQSSYFCTFYVKEKLNFRESRFRELRLIDFLQRSLPTRKKFRKTIKMSEKLPCFQNSLRVHAPIGNDGGMHAHLCAGEKGKTVARRGRKAPPSQRGEGGGCSLSPNTAIRE